MSDARKEAWDRFYALWQTDAHASDLFNIVWHAAYEAREDV